MSMKIPKTPRVAKTPVKRQRKVKPVAEVNEEVKKVEEVSGAYHIVIQARGETFVMDTDNLVESFLSFPNPMMIKSKVTFTVTANNKKFERVVLPRLAKRYFSSDNYAQLFARNITRFLA